MFRTARQVKQADFLQRDFSDAKHRQAACKNAYVLLAQHRLELAAAFFILGEFLLLIHDKQSQMHFNLLELLFGHGISPIHRTSSAWTELISGIKCTPECDARSF